MKRTILEIVLAVFTLVLWAKLSLKNKWNNLFERDESKRQWKRYKIAKRCKQWERFVNEVCPRDK